MVSIDTNIVIRWLTNDIPKNRDLIEKLLNKNTCYIDFSIIVETIFVFEYSIKMNRDDIKKAIEFLLSDKRFFIENHLLVVNALNTYVKMKKLSFIDIYLEQIAIKKKHLPLYTFDKKMLNQLKQTAALTEIKLRG
jgi:predicted nucleic-acid-binding protein